VTQHDTCPDVETLAAWYEDGLTPAERVSIDAHVSVCARCQALAAVLVRSDTAGAAAHREQRPSVAWRWAAPIAAGLAALVVWAVVRPTDRRVEMPPRPPALSAKPGPQPLPAPSAPPATENRFSAAPRREGTRADATANVPTESKRPNESIDVTTAAPPAQAMRALAETVTIVPVDIGSNDPAVRWRIRGTIVERTIDGGANWTQQDTGSHSPLTAGSSPSPDVCWIVGAGGTVLRSTDGRTWQPIRFPEAVDLVAVQATSPASATVTTVDARRFTTTDGGATWTAGGLQEF
jgi:Photosynthesis system II assembly factor YCF48